MSRIVFIWKRCRGAVPRRDAASGKRGGRSGRMRFVFDFDESGFATDPFKELADHTRSAAGGGSGSRNRGSTGF